LNKGAVALTGQEVRACVFRGEFNQFLERLAEDENLLKLLRLQETRKNDGTKAEQVLKFFAYKDWRANFDGRVENFLNSYMKHASSRFDYRAGESSFRRATSELHQICGGYFLRSDYNVTPLVQFEACIVAVAELIEGGAQIICPQHGWQDDSELKRASMGGTNTRNLLRRRIERAKALFSGAAT
jgi:hypothetical protein